jgi:PAS domain S-box-containing protein
MSIIDSLFAFSHRSGCRLARHFSYPALKRRGGVYPLIVTVALMFLALWIRLAMAPVNAGLQYVTFFPAVTLAAFIGGFGAGLLATIIGLLFATYIFTPPYYSFSTEVLKTSFWSNMVFFIDGILVSSLLEAMHRYRQQLARELKQTIDVNSDLEENTQHLKSLIDNQFAYVALLDTRGVILEINKAALDQFGYRREDVIHHYFYDLPCWSYDETVQAQLRAAMAAALQGQTARYNVAVKKGDDFIMVDFQLSPVRNDKGSIVELLPMAVDISEHIHAEEALKKSRSQLKTFIRQAPITMAMFDRDMNYLETSGPWLQDYGSGYTDLRGLNHYQVHPDLPDRWKLVHQQCLAGAMLRNEEDLWVHDDGSEQWSRWAVMPWIDENGAIGGIIVSAENITDRKQNEAHLAEQAQQLREADQRKDEFLAMLAHELRNPLAPIRNAAQILKRPDLDETRLAWCRNIIDRQVDHLVQLVDDLLDVSRISRGKIELKKEILEVSAIVQRAVETTQPLIEARHHAFTVQLPSEPIYVEGDLVRLCQVVSNLLNNAAKYTDEGGCIDLTVEQAGNDILLRVRDNGRGIAPSALPGLFELFYQVDRTLDRSEGGLGIGLSLVKSLVTMHGGEVWVSSEGRGQGSEFGIRLPRVQPAPAVPIGHAAKPKWAADLLHILVVDDNRDAAQSLSLLLTSEGHEVLLAYDGYSALEVALAERPQIVLLDIGLPGMDGYAVARALRQHPDMNRTQLIALSGYGREVDREQARAAGFNGYLTKPVDFDELHCALTQPSFDH